MTRLHVAQLKWNKSKRARALASLHSAEHCLADCMAASHHQQPVTYSHHLNISKRKSTVIQGKQIVISTMYLLNFNKSRNCSNVFFQNAWKHEIAKNCFSSLAAYAIHSPFIQTKPCSVFLHHIYGVENKLLCPVFSCIKYKTHVTKL
jgi:hypothetical protein